MGGFLVTVGFLGFIVSIVILIVRVVIKKPLKGTAIAIGAFFVVFVLGGLILPPVEDTNIENEIIEDVDDKAIEAEDVALEDEVYKFVTVQPEFPDLRAPGIELNKISLGTTYGTWVEVTAEDIRDLSGSKDVSVKTTSIGMEIKATSEDSYVLVSVLLSSNFPSIYSELELDYDPTIFFLSPLSLIDESRQISKTPTDNPSPLPIINPEDSTTCTIVVQEKEIIYYPDALGSENIRILIGELGYTVFAGLKFTQEVIANVWEDGIVEVEKRGVIATDDEGKEWISKKIRIDGKAATVMVKNK
jgi:hypothetical protein